MHSSALFVVAGLAFVLAPPVAALDVPRGTEVIHLDHVPGKFGTVHFRHAEHNQRFTRPDGSPIRCRDCHHRLAGDEPSSPQEDMRCSGCHAKYGEPQKVVAGKPAPVMVKLKPNGAIDYRSILFHEYCWACHRKTYRDERTNLRCKLCHEHGVSEETMNAPYDAGGR